MVRPLIPIIESNQGSRGSSGLVLRSTWKPYVSGELRCFCAEGSASRREMNRFRAPNMLAMVVVVVVLVLESMLLLVASVTEVRVSYSNVY
jgi:hypothetical protein